MLLPRVCRVGGVNSQIFEVRHNLTTRHQRWLQGCSWANHTAILGMFMEILNFCVFNKMVSDRKILLWFPSKWGVNHLKRWRNGEVVGKKRIMNYSQKMWPGTANWLVYYSMCQGPFFHHKVARYNWPHSFTCSCADRCCKCQISCHNKRYIQSRPRTGEVLTRH